MHEGEDAESAFEFSGSWQEFMPIALTNLLLTIVTLGIYRFWATARERRYFWSQTRFIDDRLEWTGTGLELFIGFLLVVALVLIPLFLLQFFFQGMIMRGYEGFAILLFVALYIFFFWLYGVAKFRALRYRLSRSLWHGIRGGSDDQGFAYGWSYLWKTVVGWLAAGLMVPWSMTRLWNERWNAMSFGDHQFQSSASWGNIFLRYIICYLAPWVMLIGAVIVIAIFSVGIMAGLGQEPGPVFIGFIVLIVLSLYLVLPLCALAFYAAFLREGVGTLRLAGLEFAFTARTKHWLLLFLGNLGLWLLALAVALVPLAAFGFFAELGDLQPGQEPFAGNPTGFIVFLVAIIVPFTLVGPFIRYRSWRFGVRYLEADGEIDLDALTQSRTRDPGQGEGLLDAFDVGAI